MALASDNLEKLEGYKKTRDEEVAKFWEELLRETASREEAWKALKEEHQIHEENLQYEKVTLEFAIEEEK